MINIKTEIEVRYKSSLFPNVSIEYNLLIHKKKKKHNTKNKILQINIAINYFIFILVDKIMFTILAVCEVIEMNSDRSENIRAIGP